MTDSIVMVNVERQPVQEKVKENVKEKIKEKVKESEDDEEEDNQSTVSTRDVSKSDPAEDVWRRDAEGEGDVLEEVKQETKEEKAEISIGDDGFSRHQHALRAKLKRQVLIDWEEQDSDDSSDCFQPSSWSKRRLRHLMNKDKTEQTKKKEVPPKSSTRSTCNSNKDQLGGLIMEHQSLNNSHSASQTLEWETHRQELMKSPVKESPVKESPGSILRDTLANATKDRPSLGGTLPTIVASSSSVTTLNSKTTQNGDRSSVLNGGNTKISLAGGKVVIGQG